MVTVLNGCFLEIKTTSIRQSRLPQVFCKFLVYIKKLSREQDRTVRAVGDRDRAVRQSTACQQQRLGHTQNYNLEVAQGLTTLIDYGIKNLQQVH